MRFCKSFPSSVEKNGVKEANEKRRSGRERWTRLKELNADMENILLTFLCCRVPRRYFAFFPCAELGVPGL